MFEACQLRGNAETDAGAPHFRQGDGTATSTGLITQMRLAFPQLVQRQPKVAVPFDGIEREVQMDIKNEGWIHEDR
jgi:hypothetical protein